MVAIMNLKKNPASISFDSLKTAFLAVLRAYNFALFSGRTQRNDTPSLEMVVS